MARQISLMVLVALLAGCGTGLEVTTTQAVEVLLLPNFAGTEGQRQVGVLPPGVTLAVKDQVLGKELAAYEIEYVDPATNARTKGYVLLGSPGLMVREKR
jgi:hypothetical protein